MSKIIERLINIIYPNICPLCGKELEFDHLVCKKCEGEIKYITEPICKKCGKQLQEEEKEYCGDCKTRVHYFDSGIGVFAYTGVVKKAMYEFKYKDMKVYGKFFGNKMAEYSTEYIKHWKADVLIPVPVSKKKYLKRGYNQAEILARELSKKTNMPVDTKVIYRSKDTMPQKEMSRDSRKKNLKNAFIISGNVVKYNKVILVDDIYTTGSTIDECAKALKSSGIKEVYFISQTIGLGI